MAYDGKHRVNLPSSWGLVGDPNATCYTITYPFPTVEYVPSAGLPPIVPPSNPKKKYFTKTMQKIMDEKLERGKK